MDKATLLNVAANPGKKGGGNKNSVHNDGIPSRAIIQRKHFAFFELSTGGSNHSMALTELLMLFNRVRQLYYGLANLLKVCALNLMLDKSNLGTEKLYIVYKVDLG